MNAGAKLEMFRDNMKVWGSEGPYIEVRAVGIQEPDPAGAQLGSPLAFIIVR